MTSTSSGLAAPTVTVRLDAVERDPTGNVGVGRRLDREETVLVPVEGDAAPGQEVQVTAERVADLPPALDANAARLVPLVATALGAWESLGLELGEVALVTGDGPAARLMAVAATWFGACPVLRLGASDALTLPGIETLPAGEFGPAALGARLKTRPGVVVIELSGRPDVVDLILEAIPMFTRVLFAGPPGHRLTVDFYVNVHRKGLLLRSSTLAPASSVAAAWAGDAGQRCARAARFLTVPARLAECHLALDPPRTA
jgi:hypothetical protein